MSLSVRYAGDSYEYLLASVTTDGGRPAGSAMTRYYAAHGTPPGTWLGTGLAGLAEGAGLAAGSSVTPPQMQRVFADGLDPVSGAPLGRSPHVYGSAEQRRRPVAGFDHTFTVPKSVSVLWALADQATREAVYACHRRAVADVVALLERDVARTRIGTGGAAQVEVAGVIAAAFDHWDSRDSDPNLHTHVVVANRAQAADGRWRTLDSRALHRAAVAMSERYDALLADHLTTRLGLAFEYRERGPGRNPGYDLAAFPPELMAAFSRRAAAIDTLTDELVAAYVADHGRRPSAATVLRLRQRATLGTRGPKVVHSLAELTDRWHRQATAVLGADSHGWAADALTTARLPPAAPGVVPAARSVTDDATTPVAGADRASRAADAVRTAPTSPAAPDPVAAGRSLVDDAATAVVAALTGSRPTWTAWNVDAEASRALKAQRFPTPAARDAATSAVVDEVARRSVLLTPPEEAPTPDGFRRSDGSSAFRPHRAERFTSPRILDAERRLLAAGRDTTAPTTHAAGLQQGGGLDEDQAAAADAVATSGRVVDVLVGPAGSGKTATLAALRQAWEQQHGPGSVLGLAPSAAAADVLAAALSVPTENTAKWLVEHDTEPDRLRRLQQLRTALHATRDPAAAAALTGQVERLATDITRWRFRAGQLVLVDEASLAGTLALDRLAACAGEAGAKLLLVGDWAQLSAIEAGGAFGLLVRDRGPDAPELGSPRRFTQPWARAASVRLRVGDPAAVDAYAAHDRLAEGRRDTMLDAAYTAWAADEHEGRRSLLLAGDLDTVRDLNERARADLVAAGSVEPDGTVLHDGLTAGVGDRVVTRRNDRRLPVGAGWVKNGDTWTVRARTAGGGLRVQRPGGGPTVDLPPSYVAAHVDLGYATTAFRAQGATVDTAHAVVTGPGMTREVLYVMLTRARHTNRAYVCLDRTTDQLPGLTADDPATGREVLLSVLNHVGAATSAHEVRHTETETARSIRTLTAQYETLAHEAQRPRWAALLASAGLTPDLIERVEDSPAYGALSTALRRADAHALPIDRALPRLADHLDTGAHDPAAVLHARVQHWTSASLRAGRGRPAELVGGLLPPATDVTNPQLDQALTARARLIEHRCDELLDRAITAGAPWLRRLGASGDRPGDAAWRAAARAICAYREQYAVTDPYRPLGPVPPKNEARQRADHDRTRHLLDRHPAPTASRSSTRPAAAEPAAGLCPTPLGR
jgi:conjugative relaxase-like TrwC/TraI family protein